MKKLLGMPVLLLLLWGTASAAGVMLEFRAQYFYPTDQIFRDIYGGGMMYGGEVSIGVWKGFEVWLGADYLAREGELTFTKEKTELEIVPVGVGLRYRWGKEAFSFYLGAGVNFYSYSESNPIGDVSEGGTGFKSEMGSYIRIVGGLLIDLCVNYSVCRIESPDFDLDLGGFGGGVGLAFEF